MTTKELIQTISQKTGFSPEKTGEALLAFQKILEESLKKGEEVKIRNFGTFYTRFLQSKPIPLNFKKGSPRKLRIQKKSVGFKVSDSFKLAFEKSKPTPRSPDDYRGKGESYPALTILGTGLNLDELAQSYPGFRLLRSLINISRRLGGKVLHLMSVGNPPAGGKTLVKIRKKEHLTSLGEFSEELFKRIVSDLKKILPLKEKASQGISFLLDRGQTKIEVEFIFKEEPPAELTIHLAYPSSPFPITQPFPRAFYLSLKDAFNQTRGIILVSSLRQGPKLNLAQALIKEYGEGNSVAVLTDGPELELALPHQNFDLRETPPAGGQLSQILPLIKRKGFKILLLDSILILPDLKKLLKKARDHLLVFTLIAQTPEEALQKFQRYAGKSDVTILSLSIKTAEAPPEITCYLKETEEKDLASFSSKVLNS